MLCQQTYALPIPFRGPQCRAPSACPEGLQRLLTPGGSCKHAFPSAPGMQTMHSRVLTMPVLWDWRSEATAQ